MLASMVSPRHLAGSSADVDGHGGSGACRVRTAGPRHWARNHIPRTGIFLDRGALKPPIQMRSDKKEIRGCNGLQ